MPNEIEPHHRITFTPAPLPRVLTDEEVAEAICTVCARWGITAEEITATHYMGEGG